MFTSTDVYNMFFDTITRVFNFLREAKFMGYSVLGILLTCAVISILISALVNVVQRSPVETSTGKTNRLRVERRRKRK